MKRDIIFSTVISCALLFMSGCGSSSSSNNSSSSSTQSSQSNGGQALDTSSSSQSQIVLSEVNVAPVATLDSEITNSGVPLNGKLTAVDYDLDDIDYEIVSNPSHGDISLNKKDGTFTYTPEDGYIGEDSFSYVAKDGVSSSSPKNVTINVTKKPILTPKAPSNLRLEALSVCKIQISWDDNSDNERGFEIYKDGELVSVEKANTTTTNICTDMLPATTYYIEVKAKNEAGSSEAVGGYVTTKDITLPPKAPTNLEVKALSENTVRIGWIDNAWSDSSYEIYQDGGLVKTVSAECSSVVIKDLEPDSSYEFVVKAVNKIGKSTSNTLIVETKGVPHITLNGTDEELVVGDVYKERGAVATDREDGDLKVRIIGDVNSSKEGSYTIAYEAVDSDGNSDFAIRKVDVKSVSTASLEGIYYDSNIELGGEKGVLYYADPRPEENGLNRALRIDYINWSFDELNVSGINPHSIDRAGDSDKFYIRTQNSHSFDVISFVDNSVKTVDLGAHKPRAIGGVNLKHHLQLLSVKNRAVVDVIDTTTDEVIARLGDDRDENITGEYNYDRSKLTSNAGSGSATGHSFWLDSDHFALIDRVNSKVVVYEVIDNGGEFSFKETSSLPTKTALHAIERIFNPVTRKELVTFYEIGEGDLSKGIDPFVQEIIYDPETGTITNGKEAILTDASKTKVDGKAPTTHHARVTPDKKYIYVPTFDHKVHIVDLATMKVVKVLPAGFGAAHVTYSKQLHLAVITNHFDDFVTIIDTDKQEVIKDIKISDHEFHGHLLQPHFSYVSDDGKYYYTFDTQAGDFIKINLETLEVEDKLHTGGAPEQAHS